MRRSVRDGLRLVTTTGVVVTLGLFSPPAGSEEPHPTPAGPPRPSPVEVAPPMEKAPRPGDPAPEVEPKSTAHGWQIAPEHVRPEFFQPGVISRSTDECRPAFDLWGRGGWAYFATGTIETPHVSIVVSRFDPLEKRWLRPHPAPEFAGFVAADPCINSDGTRILFASNRAADGRTGADFDLWETHRNGFGWSPPTRLPDTVNGPGNEASPCLTDRGTLYFTSDRAGGQGGRDVYRCRLVEGAWLPAENLGVNVNTPARETHVCLDPQERWLVVASDRPGGEGGLDLWLALADSAGGWRAPTNVGAPVNSAADEFAPVLWSPPGEKGYPGWSRYFFYSSCRRRDIAQLRQTGQYRGRGKGADDPGNGRADIYQASLVTLGIPNDSIW